MAFAFVQSESYASAAPSTTHAISLTGVGAGNLIAIFSSYFVDTTCSISDGTATLTNGTTRKNTAVTRISLWSYLLASTSGNKTYTQTLGSSDNSGMEVYEFSYSGVASFDAQATNSTDAGDSSSVSSTNLTTTGTDEVVLGGYAPFSAGALTSPLINAVAADGSIVNDPVGSFNGSWFRIVTATFTGAATATLTPAADWNCNAIAFKAADADIQGLLLRGVGSN